MTNNSLRTRKTDTDTTMNAKCQSSNVKWLMSNDKETRARTRITSTNHTDTKHEHESQCQSSKVGIPGKPEKRSLSEGEFGQQKEMHWSEGATMFPANARNISQMDVDLDGHSIYNTEDRRHIGILAKRSMPNMMNS